MTTPYHYVVEQIGPGKEVAWIYRDGREHAVAVHVPVECAKELVEAANAHEGLVAALRDCVKLIAHMSPYVKDMALPDYALFNNAPATAATLIAQHRRNG